MIELLLNSMLSDVYTILVEILEICRKKNEVVLRRSDKDLEIKNLGFVSERRERLINVQSECTYNC